MSEKKQAKKAVKQAAKAAKKAEKTPVTSAPPSAPPPPSPYAPDTGGRPTPPGATPSPYAPAPSNPFEGGVGLSSPPSGGASPVPGTPTGPPAAGGSPPARGGGGRRPGSGRGRLNPNDPATYKNPANAGPEGETVDEKKKRLDLEDRYGKKEATDILKQKDVISGLQARKDAGETLTDEEETQLSQAKNAQRNDKGESKNLDAQSRADDTNAKLQNFQNEAFQSGGELREGLKTGTSKLGDLISNPGALHTDAGGANPYSSYMSDLSARQSAGAAAELNQNLARSGRATSGMGTALRASGGLAADRAQADNARQGLAMGENLYRSDLSQVMPILGEQQRETEFGRQFLMGQDTTKNAQRDADAAQKMANIQAGAAVAGTAFTGGASLAAMPKPAAGTVENPYAGTDQARYKDAMKD